MRKLFNKLFKKSPITDRETVVIFNTIEELDQHLHDRTMESLEAERKGITLSPMIKVKISDELFEKFNGADNLYEAVMMRSMKRAMTDPALNRNFYKPNRLAEVKMSKMDDVVNKTFH